MLRCMIHWLHQLLLQGSTASPALTQPPQHSLDAPTKHSLQPCRSATLLVRPSLRTLLSPLQGLHKLFIMYLCHTFMVQLSPVGKEYIHIAAAEQPPELAAVPRDEAGVAGGHRNKRAALPRKPHCGADRLLRAQHLPQVPLHY